MAIAHEKAGVASAVSLRREAGNDGKDVRNATSDRFPRIRCPRCKASLETLNCDFCGLTMRVSRGIVHALPPDRVSHFARFIADYEHIRKAEGRGSTSDEFYLNLPFRNISGPKQQWDVRALTYSCLMDEIFWGDGSSGRAVLDLGAGNCWLSYRLALAGLRPVAVDLLTNDFDGLGAACHFEKQLPGLFPRFQAELACLPFEDDQFDVVIFNASFHYAEDPSRALGEALRCVKPGGIAVIADTPWYSKDESGRAMVAERRAFFLQSYGTASDSIQSFEYLTDQRLDALAERHSIEWQVLYPSYGLRWLMRPFVAKLRGRREPSRFRIYVAKKC
jgi:SAM-dependent methyltransferase